MMNRFQNLLSVSLFRPYVVEQRGSGSGTKETVASAGVEYDPRAGGFCPPAPAAEQVDPPLIADEASLAAAAAGGLLCDGDPDLGGLVQLEPSFWLCVLLVPILRLK
jgi:hypothetical protein